MDLTVKDEVDLPLFCICQISSTETSNPYAHSFYLDIVNAYKEKFNKNTMKDEKTNDWVSPSDYFIGKTDLVPPYTNRCHKSKTHEGVLTIGEKVLQDEYIKFENKINLLHVENGQIWNFLQEHGRNKDTHAEIAKLREIYKSKFNTMLREFELFYKKTLDQLEHHIHDELMEVIARTQAEVISSMNQRKDKLLRREEKSLRKILENSNADEIQRVEREIDFILNCLKQHSTLQIDEVSRKKDEALEVLYNHMQCQKMTGLMFVLCNERNKCKIKQYVIDRHYNEKEQALKSNICRKQKIIEKLANNYQEPDLVTAEWKNKIRAIMEKFGSFISYSLKLLPIHSDFLINLEKLMILQMSEVVKLEGTKHSILIDDNDVDANNILQFHDQVTVADLPSDKKPFVIYGDLTKEETPQFGSHETLPDDVALPMMLINKKYAFARPEYLNFFQGLMNCSCHALETDFEIRENSTTSFSSSESSMPTPKSQVTNKVSKPFSQNINVLRIEYKKVSEHDNFPVNDESCHPNSEINSPNLPSLSILDTDVKVGCQRNTFSSPNETPCTHDSNKIKKNCFCDEKILGNEDERESYNKIESTYSNTESCVSSVNLECVSKKCFNVYCQSLKKHFKEFDINDKLDIDEIIQTFNYLKDETKEHTAFENKSDISVSGRKSENKLHKRIVENFISFPLNKDASTQYTVPECFCVQDALKSSNETVDNGNVSQRRIDAIREIINLHPSIANMFTLNNLKEC